MSAATLLRVEEDTLGEARVRLLGYLARFHEASTTLSLDLSGYELRRMPPRIKEMTYLTELSLRNNRLASVPPSIRLLGASLRSIDLSYNRLSSLPMDLRFQNPQSLTICLILPHFKSPSNEIPENNFA